MNVFRTTSSMDEEIQLTHLYTQRVRQPVNSYKTRETWKYDFLYFVYKDMCVCVCD